ncbi:MAG TPA: SHOCT domain-containing protein [Acidimicrobiia bacterium]
MGLVRGIARTAAIAGTATAVSNRVSRRQANRWSEQAAEEPQPEQVVYVQAEPAAPAGPSTDDKLGQLKQLGELKDAGVLTEAEFEAQKAKILAG